MSTASALPRIAAILLAPTLACLTMTATAQEADPVLQDAADLGSVVVTGEKFGRTLVETTSSVVVWTGAELEDRSVKDLYDVVLRTPNVTQSFGEKGFTIRGIDQRLGAGSGLLISVVVDGAALPNNQSTFFGPYSTWDLGQIEILRGPQGTVQGRNAIGGTIIINSADPELDRFSGKARGSLAELGSYQAAAALNVPIVENALAVRLAADRRETDGWVTNPTRDGEDYDARDATTGRLKLLYSPSDEFEAKYTLSSTDSRGGEDLVDLSAWPAQRINTSNLAAEEGSEHLINTLELNWFPSHTIDVTSLTTLYQHDYVRLEDLDNTAADLGGLDRTQDDQSFTQEVRMKYDANGSLRALAGVFFGAFENIGIDGLVLPTSFLNPALPPGLIFQDRDNRTDEENLALFGEVEIDLGDRFTVIAGGRYDRESRDFSSVTSTSTDNPAVGPLLPPDELISNSTDYSAFLPKLGVRYALSTETTLGLVAQRAYRAGGTGVAPVSGQVAQFDPEYTWTYEASLRSYLPESRIAIQANVFLTEWRDQIVNQTTQFGLDNGIPIDAIPVNAGESELYGFEVALDAALTPDLTVFAMLGYVETEYVDFVSPTEDLSGNQFQNASPVTASAGVNWTSDRGFSLRADVNYRDEFFSIDSNDPARVVLEDIVNDMGQVIGQRQTCAASPCNDPRSRVDSALITNLKAGYESGNWSVFLFARNLFDEEYLTQRNLPSGGFPDGQGRTGEPRVVGVEFNLQF